jgi:hypothetical protein
MFHLEESPGRGLLEGICWRGPLDGTPVWSQEVSPSGGPRGVPIRGPLGVGILKLPLLGSSEGVPLEGLLQGSPEMFCWSESKGDGSLEGVPGVVLSRDNLGGTPRGVPWTDACRSHLEGYPGGGPLDGSNECSSGGVQCWPPLERFPA